jgi:hypothetical protein
MSKLGVLSKEQVEKSGKVQAAMLAVKNKIQSGELSESDAQLILGEFRGQTDFMSLCFKDIDRTLIDLDVTDTELKAAQAVVDNREGVNKPDDAIKLPPIGMIHGKLHISRDLAQAFLVAQQSVRAANCEYRLASGQSDPAIHETRREFNFDNSRDDQRLQDIQSAHKKLSVNEGQNKENLILYVTPEVHEAVYDGFANAEKMFSDQGYPELAEKIKAVSTHQKARLLEVKKKLDSGLETRDIVAGAPDPDGP